MNVSLIKRIRQHDQQAMSALYQQCVGMLSSVCYRYVPTKDDAKDILQNSFVKIFKAIPKMEYRDENTFKRWMVRIVVNESISFLRSQKRLQYVEQDAREMVHLPNEEEPDSDFISVEVLHQLVKELPDGYRTVVNLYVFEGWSHKQIAEILGIKESTSASQLYYAKRVLAKRIKEIMKEER